MDWLLGELTARFTPLGIGPHGLPAAACVPAATSVHPTSRLLVPHPPSPFPVYLLLPTLALLRPRVLVQKPPMSLPKLQ